MQNVNYICEFLQTITSLFNAKLFRMTSEIYENLSLYKTHQRLYRKTTAKNTLNKAIMKIKKNRFPLLAFSLSRLSTQLCIYIQTSLILNIFLIIYKSSLFFAIIYTSRNVLKFCLQFSYNFYFAFKCIKRVTVKIISKII